MFDDDLPPNPSREDLRRWARRQAARPVPPRPAQVRDRPWPSGARLGAAIFLFRNLPRIR